MLEASAVTDDPVTNLQLALGVELAVIPPYPYALWSIKPAAEGAGPAATEAARASFLMDPAMRFLSAPLQFQAWRGRICAATDPAPFDAAAYVPVTRALSAGQRRMLELWNSYADGEVPSSPGRPKIVRRS